MANCRICYPKDNNSLYVCNHCRETFNTMKSLLQMIAYPIGLVLTFENKEYVVIKIQPEGIRLRGTKNNPLGERFEMVVNETLDSPIYLSCPFCGVDDFDLVGLKIHLSNRWCNEFNGLDERSWNEIVVDEKKIVQEKL